MLASALERWTAVLGPDGVADPASYQTTTFATHQRVPAVLRPSSTEEVQAIVRIANEHRVPLYPISTGRNWGFGGRVPVEDGCVVVDLGRMKRIVDFDPQLAYVTVEPGVTQAQLYRFLAEQTSRLWMDATTSSPDASIVGNTLERGHGLTPYADHARTVCGLEVVLGNGERVCTGYGRFSGTPLAPLDAFGCGPALDGLFVQSRFGIVTRMTVWLYPEPERVEALFFGVDDDALFARTVDTLLPAKLHGQISVGPRFGNEYRTLQNLMRFPWQTGEPPLRPEVAAELGASRWSGFVAFHGATGQVIAQRDHIERLLGTLGIAPERSSVWPEPDAGPRATFGRLLRGEPFGASVARPYWRKREPPPAELDPERDRCGFLWCAPLLPFRGADARRVSDITREVILRHGFEPDLSLLALRERVLHAHISIVYDRDVAGHDAGALACHDELIATLASAGYLPHRLGIHSMAMQATGDPSYVRLLQSLARALDPNGILAPGRYVR